MGNGCIIEDDSVISFGPTDLEGVIIPYEDALVIRVIIANHEVV